jgi:sugar O-acyltransferase (sialic acid O-acetyltransferase NeuD family)
MLELIIVGAGGFGREVYHWARQAFSPRDYRLKGFLSRDRRELEPFQIPVPVLGDPDEYQPEPNDRFLFAIGLIDIKRQVIETLVGKGARFVSLVHPTALVADTARIGQGVIICPFATVSDQVELGDYVMLNFYASCGHDARVGAYSILSPYATLNGFSVLAEEVFLGTHATVTASRRVGARSKVSANSLVMHDVAPRTLVYGVPGVHRALFG